jgi:putative transcriptional regulator
MKSLRGHLLVAVPGLHDQNFCRTVLLLFEHTAEGASGVVLNRPIGVTVTEISDQLLPERFAWEKPLHLGGPVPGPLLLLHTVGDLSDREIFAGVHTTAEAPKVQQLIRRRPEPSRIVANYAGWGPGQLEEEIAADAWLCLPATADHVFRPGGVDLWESLMKEICDPGLSLPQFLGLREVPVDPKLN